VFDSHQSSCASSSSSENLRLRALIEGRSVSSVSTSPKSLLEVFRNPYRYKDQSLAGLLSDVAGALVERVEKDLKQRPLTKEGEVALTVELMNLGLENNKEAIQKASSRVGWELMKALGYVFEQDYIPSEPAAFLVGIIGLAQVGRKLSDWLTQGRSEEERIKALSQLQVIAEMILGKESEWDQLRGDKNEGRWFANRRAFTVDECKSIYSEGGRNFNHLQLFGKDGERDLSGTNFSGANFTLASLRGANLKGTNLSRADLRGAHLEDVDLDGANIEGALIDIYALSSLNTGEGFGDKTCGQKINAWRARGGLIYLLNAQLSDEDLKDSNLQGLSIRIVPLIKANLQRADLRGADLFMARLQGANLSGADLRGANLQGAVIDLKALKTLRIRDIGFWAWLRAGGKKRWWKKKGGIVVDG
jgi:uncharacterized protein YjbI with pentapeptide repeats